MNNRFLTICVFIALLFSCGKKWKKTTDVNLRFIMAQNSTGVFAVTSGTLVIGEINFSGNRKEGGGVSFSDVQANPLSLHFNTGAAQSSIHYDIPQGVYKSVNFNIKTVAQTAVPSIVISGIFTPLVTHNDFDDDHKKTKTFSVLFEYNTGQSFNINASSTKGGKEIVLIEGTPAICEVSFDPSYWFAPVTESQYKKASLDTLGGIATIVISETKNQDLYNLVAPRITETVKAVFKQ